MTLTLKTARTLFFRIATALVLVSPVAAQEGGGDGDMRLFCTQHGPFHLLLDGDKGAGVYRINANDHIGAIVGVIDDGVLNGTWSESESHGAIRISFSGDLSSFEAAYSIAPDLDDWHTGWKGYLPPVGDGVSFNIAGEKYLCE